MLNFKKKNTFFSFSTFLTHFFSETMKLKENAEAIILKLKKSAQRNASRDSFL